jgi:hypothetical protein
MFSRRRPKRIASIDQEPGPSMATAALMAIRSIAGWGATLPANNSQDSAATAKRQLTGVKKPISMRNPAAIPMPAVAIAAQRASGIDLATPCVSNKLPAAMRKVSRPQPGQPFGKMEKRRCTKKMACRGRLCRKTGRGNTHKSAIFPTRFGYLQIHDSPLNGDGYGVCAIICIQFRQDVFDVHLHRFF